MPLGMIDQENREVRGTRTTKDLKVNFLKVIPGSLLDKDSGLLKPTAITCFFARMLLLCMPYKGIQGKQPIKYILT